MTLSENIKTNRKNKKISQELLAEKLGVSRQAVSKWETGESEPSTQNLLQLAEILEIDVNVLLSESKERKVFAKEMIEQKGIRTILSKRNSIFLIFSCVAQMFIFGVNIGIYDTYKMVLAIVSLLLITTLLCNIWFRTAKSVRPNLILRVFIFLLLFNAIIVGTSHLLGGFGVFVIGCAFIALSVKTYSPNR